MSDYSIRDEFLKSIGFDSYQSYLESDLWESIRSRAMKKGKKLCAVCKNAAIEVHHKSYSEDVLSGKNISLLICLCRTCHDLIEFDSRGSKRTLSEANRALSEMLECELKYIARESKIPRRRRIELAESARRYGLPR